MRRSFKSKALLFFTLVVSLAMGYAANSFAYHVMSQKGSIIEQMSAGIETFPHFLMQGFFFEYTNTSLLWAGVAVILVWLIYLYNFFMPKKYRRGEEHGSAEWGTHADSMHYRDHENPENNIILSESDFLRLTGRNEPEYDPNRNVVVYGTPGSGKTRFVIKPNMMQMHSSYVVTDPKGTLLRETGKLFTENGYEVKVLNTVNMAKSMHYNPLAYIKEEDDILRLVTVIMENTKGEGAHSGDEFWIKAERMWYMACISYLYYECNESDRHLPMLIDMLEASGAREENEDFVSPLDILFEELEEKNPKHFAVRQYKMFKLAAGKTLKSILVSCAARLAPFDLQKLKGIMVDDELELDKIGDRKTIFYVIMSDTNTTFAFVIAMCMYQMIDLLCAHADSDVCGGKLPVHVRLLLDEFANIGRIPNFENTISTIRSREISAMIILQSVAQLHKWYKEAADIIVECCASTIFLGGKSQKTSEAISKMLGSSTIDNTNINESRGQTGSYSINNQNLKRDLLDPSEVMRMSRKKCIVHIEGQKPFMSKKYDIRKHKRYKYLSDFNEDNLFNVDELIESHKVRESTEIPIPERGERYLYQHVGRYDIEEDRIIEEVAEEINSFAR